jgi:hypothetical protein
LCCKSRIKQYRQTAFNFTLFAGEVDISFDLGQSGFKLITEEITFNLPTSASVKPWQLPILKKILPNLRVIQITAFSGPQEPLSWSIFYPPPAGN